MTSTPGGRSSSWLKTLVLVRARRQALWRLPVFSLGLGDGGEPAVSKLNIDGDTVSLSGV